LVPLKNPLVRVFSGVTFYFVLPLAMMLFAWKAAVFPAWGSGLLCVAVGVIASHSILPLGKVSWRSKALLTVIAAIIAAAVMFSFGPIRRPFDLSRANLSNQWLARTNLSGANLSSANLSSAKLFDANLSNAHLQLANLFGADLSGTDLSGANLFGANLSGADLRLANLSGANLFFANLKGADLSGADLSDAGLVGADLGGADLSRAALAKARELSEACGNESTKLPEGFTVRPCSEKR
jgi:hypothetical protein